MANKKHRSDDKSTGFGYEFGSFFRTLCNLLLIGLVCFSIFMMLSLFRISSYAFATYDSLNALPHNEVGLLLGTSPLTSDGNINPFFANRIRAATLLYRKGKIDYIIVSGDNRHQSYNEPRLMMQALVREGIPKERIVLDFAGFSTLDSVVRASKVFMQRDITIISQSFHNERALFIAKREGLNAVAFNAADPTSKLAHFIVYFREFFARVKCVFDVYFLNTQAKFLGDPIQIGDSPLPKQISNMPKRATSQPKHPGPAASVLFGRKKVETIAVKEQTDAAVFLKQADAAREHLHQVVERDEENYIPPQRYYGESKITSLQQGSLSNP